MIVTEAMAVLMESWLSRSKHNSLHALSSRSGISYSTVTRLAQGKIEKPQLDIVISLLPILATEVERSEFLQKYYPGVFKLVERERSQRTEVPREEVCHQQEIENLFQDPLGFLLAQQLFSRVGISTSKIKELYGDMGLQMIKDLDSKSLVVFQDGVWKTNFDYSSATFESNRQQLITSARAFRADSVGASAGYISTLSESVSLEAAQQMTQEIQECVKRLREIRDRNPGPHVFVANLSMYLADPLMALEEEASK